MLIEKKLSDTTPFWGSSVRKKGLGNRPLTLTRSLSFEVGKPDFSAEFRKNYSRAKTFVNHYLIKKPLAIPLGGESQGPGLIREKPA
jgi:hypothetical protein